MLSCSRSVCLFVSRIWIAEVVRNEIQFGMQIYYYNIRSSSLILFVIVLFLTEYFVYRFIITISRSGLIFAAIDSFLKELFFMDFHQFHFFSAVSFHFVHRDFFLSFCWQGLFPFILFTGVVLTQMKFCIQIS